jgi:CubicO group peptidase (beta-lactamase class C family)
MADDSIDTAFQSAIDAGKIHGAIILATDTAGAFTYQKTIGNRTLLTGEKKPHEIDNVLFLASATKLITAIAALTCVEDGLLTLQGDLSSVAPELAAKQVLIGFDEATGEPILEPQQRPITLEMLLTHSAGTNYHFLDPVLARWREKFLTRPKNAVLTVEEACVDPLRYQPGSGWMYGPGLDWAGRIVERVTGKTLQERMQERIFDPLSITDAQFYPVTREDMRSRLVDLTPDDPECVGRAVLGGGGDMNRTSRGNWGGHGLFMTGPDYLKVLRSIMANDGKILKPATVDTMFEQHLTAEGAASHHAALTTPMGPFFAVGVDPASKPGYGLSGMLTLEDAEGFYGAKTLSWGGGLTFVWFMDRQNDLAAVGAINTVLPVDQMVIADLKNIIRHDIYRKRKEKEASEA